MFILKTYKSLEDVIKTSFRRCLCFPLYRNWELNKLILKDLIKLLKTGNRDKLIKFKFATHTKQIIDFKNVFSRSEKK